MEGSKLKTAFVLYLAGVIALNALILWQVHNSILEGYSDFAALYTAGKLVQQGRASALYDRRTQWQVQQEFASAVKIRRGPLPYIRPPFEALLFWPLAHLKYPAACLLWMALKVVILLAVPFLLLPIRGEPKATSGILGGLVGLAFFPVVFDLLQGQD
jgi:Glycosyltransferase family 87